MDHLQVPQTGSWYRGDGEPKGPGNGDNAPSDLSGTPKRNSSCGSKTGFGTLQAPTPPSGTKDGTMWKAASSPHKYGNQPSYYYCRAYEHFRYNCPKLVIASTPRSSQKSVTLLVWPDQDRGDELLAPVGRRGGKTRGVARMSVKAGGQAGPPVSPRKSTVGLLPSLLL